jgi:hypothetical protein
MRSGLPWLAFILLLPGCSRDFPVGQQLDNIVATSTEYTGAWSVSERTEEEGRIRIRAKAARLEHAEGIARRILDQQLDRSPSEVVVEVFGHDAVGGTPAARLVWQRPANTPLASMPPAISDPHGASSADRQGSPERAVGRNER